MGNDIDERLEAFLSSSEILEELQKLTSNGKRSLVLDFDKLLEEDTELANHLLDNPSKFLEKADAVLKDITEIPRFHLRVKNLDETVELREVRADDVGKFIQLEGILTRASDVKPEIKIATFKCLKCGEKNKVQQPGEQFREPRVCQNPNCSKKGPFRLEAEESDFVDWQSMRIQELPEKLGGGRIPRYLNSVARDDIVDKAVPGNQVLVTGILRAFQESKRNKKKTTFQKVLEINHITVKEKSVEETELSEEDEEWIEDLKENHRVRNLFINSVAPSIFGYEKIKEAIALQLVGSPAVELPDGSRIRGDSHILMTGDPGTAKSQLLKWTNKVTPRGVYTSGKKATGAGLCVVPDSLIMLGDGSLVEIGDFVENNLEEENSKPEKPLIETPKESREITSLDVDRFRNITKNIEKVCKIPAPETLIQIETKQGKSLKLTPENPLLVMREDGPAWVKAEDLEEGDFLATHRKLDVRKGKPLPLIERIRETVYGMETEDFVNEAVKKLKAEYGTIRAASDALDLSEDGLYYRWRRNEVRGNPSLSVLLKLARETGLGVRKLAEHLECFRQVDGKKIRIPKYPNSDFMYFLGMMAADGRVGNTPGGGRDIRFFNTDRGLLQKFQSLVESLFGIDSNLKSNGKRTPRVRFFSKVIGDLLDTFGVPKGEKAHRIDIPPHITTLSDSLLASYLQGLFDCEGAVIEGRTRGSDSVQYSTTSRNLARKMQLLLLRFGIVAKMRTRDRRGEISVFKDREMTSKRRKYELIIRGLDSLSIFRDKIGFSSTRKKSKLERIIGKLSCSNPNSDVVPHAGRIINRTRKALDIPATRLYERTSHRVEKDEIYPTREFLSEVVNEMEPALADGAGVEELSLLRKLASSDIYWDSIKEVKLVEDHGIDYVYDLSIEGVHNFMANGIVVHNTAAAVRDEMTGGWTLEAGALAIGDGGLACIDEFDKMSDEDSGAILESMEQQTISVAKAGIVATLNTRTSILAAANPRLGRFDKYDPIPQQIDLPALILSRFDLIFVLRDIPKEEKDRDLAQHMLNLQSDPDTAVKPELTQEEIRKLVIYAKKYIHPTFKNKEVKKKLEDFFVQWRKVAGGEAASEDEVVPITARQLEALVRLAKSNARLRLSGEVTVEDADRAIDIYRASLKQLGIEDESGKPDIDMLMTGHSRTQHEKLQRIMEIIDELEKDYEEGAPIKLVKEEARAEGIDQKFVEETIRREKRNGRLYSPSEEMISRATR